MIDFTHMHSHTCIHTCVHTHTHTHICSLVTEKMTQSDMSFWISKQVWRYPYLSTSLMDQTVSKILKEGTKLLFFSQQFAFVKHVHLLHIKLWAKHCMLWCAFLFLLLDNLMTFKWGHSNSLSLSTGIFSYTFALFSPRGHGCEV